MPASLAAESLVRTSASFEALPEDIDVREELNGRHDIPDIEWLIQSILNHGQLQPVPVWNDGGTPVLIAGFSRWRAISEINKRGLTPNPLKLKMTFIRNVNERSAFVMNIQENRFRNETTLVDDAHNIQRLLNGFQMGDEEIAKLYFPTAATEAELAKAVKWVKDRVALIGLTPEAEEAVKSGRIKGTAAVAIAKLKSSQQREIVAKEGPITGADVKAVNAKAPKLKPMEPELRRRITAVCESAPWETVEPDDTHTSVDVELLCALKNYVEEHP